MTPAPLPRSLRLVRVLGWLAFGAGLLLFCALFLRFGTSSVPKARWSSRWGQPHWITTRDPGGQFRIDYPSNWDLSTPFDRFTRHRIGRMVAVDTMAIRRGKPVGMLV